jgi:hypothetical protein
MQEEMKKKNKPSIFCFQVDCIFFFADDSIILSLFIFFFIRFLITIKYLLFTIHFHILNHCYHTIQKYK